ncbi:MAG: sugar phosphate nucleotidyltransferase [Deltaproteobacteria bacterium]|nr:sugar phosphate nucleotidyltransferase [Deltaproteobacteria bacterium]MCL5276363.1 sugar phosphate nucleotidyltransferase [Deltaproteobacteria bacterium]
MNVYGVIIAGGQGKRLWPLSRTARPKPVLAVPKGLPLIRQALGRLGQVVESRNIMVVTNEEVFAPTYDAIRELPVENVISEPISKNTAAAIGLACVHILAKEKDAVVIVTPSDHYIKDEGQFARLLKRAVGTCSESDVVIVFGVKPRGPSTNYGYIARGEGLEGPDVQKGAHALCRVTGFTEKPSRERAEQFISEGYLWNAGVFVFRASTMIAAIRKHLPELASALDTIKQHMKGPYERKTIKEEYARLSDISVDKGIIERLDNMVVMEMDTEWADLGSFEQIADIMVPGDENGNQRIGSGFDLNSTDTLVISEDSLVVTADVHDIIVVVSEGRVLIARKGSDNTISAVVSRLKADGLKEYL